MSNSICPTCGIQYAAGDEPPDTCLICADERQFVDWSGQQWTTLRELQQDYHNVFKTLEPGLTEISTHPQFAIGQRALLLQAPEGNVLWDCITLIDEFTIAAVRALGGISAIAISHPHFYSAMIEWARAFDAPVYLHQADRSWIARPDPAIKFWEGETKSLAAGLTLIHCGGHFAGSAVLHWSAGADGRGVLLSGDTLQVTFDRRYVSFMYSFPNLIPLSAAAVRRIVSAVDPYQFDRIYGAFRGRIIATDAKASVARSAERYIKAIEGELSNP